MSNITITTSEAVKQLKAVMQELKELKTTSNSVGLKSAKSLSKIEEQLKKIKAANVSTNKSFKSLEISLNKNTRAQNQNTAAQRSSRVATNQLTSATYKKIAADKKSNKETKESTSNTKKLISSARRLAIAFGVIEGLKIFYSLLKPTYDLIKQLDSVDFAMNTLIKRTDQLTSSQSFLLDITDSYGLELVSTSQRYLKFLASAQQVNLSLNSTQKIFRSVSKAAAVLGLKTDEVTGVYLALEQMLSKGKVTTEELRRQLGERLPGAMGIMASALDVTIPKLDKMLKKGEVLSSEALPKFAEALEEAYGIEAVTTIDTLVAAQNRLSNAWKVFRKTLADAAPWMEQSLKWWQNTTAEALKYFSLLLGTEEIKLQSNVAEQTKKVQEEMNKSSKLVVNATAKQGQRLKEIDEKIQNQRLLLAKQYNQEDIKRENKVLDELTLLKSNFNKKIKKENISWAKQRILSESNTNELLKKEYEKQVADLKEFEKTKQELGPGSILSLKGFFKNNPLTKEGRENEEKDQEKLKKANEGLLRINAILPKLRDNFSESTARLNIFKGLIEETFVLPDITPDDDAKIKINTDELDADILKLKNNIKDINALIAMDSTTSEQRVGMLNDLFLEESKLIEKQYEKELKLAGVNNNKKLAALEKQDQAEEDLQIKFRGRKTDLREKDFKKELEEIVNHNNNLLNLEKIRLTKSFEKKSSPTKKEKKQYKTDISEATRLSNNKTLEDQAVFITDYLKTLDVFGADRVKLERKVQELLAGIRAKTSEDDLEDYKFKAEEILGFIKDFISEAGNLADAIFENRISKIDAEINAEEEKYDKLIALAENDASRQAALEKEKEAKTAILEKKKLKEEQKRAKVRKAFAIAEIAINTAIAIMRSYSDTGPIAGSVFAAIIGTLGAIQIAAVLAQPIPQYKDGIESVPENQIAMINDGGQKEYVERGGQILSTDTKNAIVKLKAEDTVYKNKREMMSKSQIYAKNNNIVSSIKVEKQLDENKIERAITKGFNKAKINNTFNFNTQSSNTYLKEKSRFNG